MPDTVRVVGTVHCPECGLPLLGSARFRWGAVPGWETDLGCESVWTRDEQDRPYLPFILVPFEERTWMWNYGDPRFRHVILLDTDLYYCQQRLDCSRCQTEIVAVGCTVKDGFYREIYGLTDARLDALLGSARDHADCVVVADDGSYWPREDWFDDLPLVTLEKVPADRRTVIELSEIPWLTPPKE
jgi:hypothetical protein